MTTQCCPDGSLPALKEEYTPVGKEIDLDGLKCYISGEASTGKAVIVFYDIFGYNGGRTKAICDQIANDGYYVVLPDIYHGDGWKPGVPLDGKVMELVKKFPWHPLIKQDTDKVLNHLEELSMTSIGTLGFCAGAFSVFHLCENVKLKCGASMHPSVQLCKNFGETPEALAEQVKCPQLLYPAGGDPDFYKKGGDVYEILEKKFGNKNDMKEFPDMAHGWVPRGDLSKPEVERDVRSALDGLKMFLSKHL